MVIRCPAEPSATSSEQRFKSARLKKMNTENANSQELVATPTATEPATIRSVYRIDSVSTSTRTYSFSFQLYAVVVTRYSRSTTRKPNDNPAASSRPADRRTAA